MRIEKPWFNFPVLEYNVEDGDTVWVRCDTGFYNTHSCSIRLLGVDAPSIRLLRERPAGEHVQEAVEQWVKAYSSDPGIEMLAQSAEISAKYHNRALGDIIAWESGDRQYSLVEFLKDAGLVKLYSGDTKEHWTGQELRAVLAVDIAQALNDQIVKVEEARDQDLSRGAGRDSQEDDMEEDDDCWGGPGGCVGSDPGLERVFRSVPRRRHKR
jgi:hypothetical protein